MILKEKNVMDIDSLTLGQIKQLRGIIGGSAETQPLPFVVGEKLLIRTVTHYLTGKVKEVIGKFLILSDAAWIADTGRFSEALKTGTLSEVEACEVEPRLNTDAIVDVFPWNHALPRETK